jgi:hypothetical protein
LFSNSRRKTIRRELLEANGTNGVRELELR